MQLTSIYYVIIYEYDKKILAEFLALAHVSYQYVKKKYVHKWMSMTSFFLLRHPFGHCEVLYFVKLLSHSNSTRSFVFNKELKINVIYVV